MEKIKVTQEELEIVRDAIDRPVLISPGGAMPKSAGDLVRELCNKYNVPAGMGLDIQTGEFVRD